MTVDECTKRINDLRDLTNLYKRLYNDVKSTFYKCPALKTINSKAYAELLELEDLRHNQELEDSYDQNTGR